MSPDSGRARTHGSAESRTITHYYRRPLAVVGATDEGGKMNRDSGRARMHSSADKIAARGMM
jgi:hypothetical protein